MEKKQSVMGRFVSYFKPHWKLFTLDMACAVLIAVVDIIFPIVSREALNRWLPQQEYRVFFIVMAIVPLAFVLSRFTTLPILPLYFICCSTDLVKSAIGAYMIKQGKWIQNLTAK